VAQSYLKTDKYLIGTEVYPTYNLNLRKAPNGEKISVLTKGTKLKILSDPTEVGGYTWVKVQVLQ